MVYATLFTVLYDHTAYIELFEPIGLCFYSLFVSSNHGAIVLYQKHSFTCYGTEP